MKSILKCSLIGGGVLALLTYILLEKIQYINLIGLYLPALIFFPFGIYFFLRDYLKSTTKVNCSYFERVFIGIVFSIVSILLCMLFFLIAYRRENNIARITSVLIGYSPIYLFFALFIPLIFLRNKKKS